MGYEKRVTIRVETKEPVLLLLIGHDVDQCGGPFGPVHVLELLQEDLDLLSIGGALSDEMETFGFFDGGGGLIGEQGLGHSSKSGAISYGYRLKGLKGLKVTQVLCDSLS